MLCVVLIPLTVTICARDQDLKSGGTDKDKGGHMRPKRREVRSEEKTGDGDE